MAGLTPLEFAALLKNMPQDMAVEAATIAKAAGGAAAEAVEIFEVASPEAATLAEEALAVAATALPGRWWVWLIKIAGLIGLESIVEKVLSKGAAGGLALAVGHWPNMAAEVVKKVYEGLDTYTPIGATVMGLIYDRVFKGGINQDAIERAMATVPGYAQDPKAESDTFGLLGSAFNDIFDQMFDINGVAEDFKGRTQSFGSHKNFRRVMGANLSVGIRAQTMAIVSQLFPLGPLQHLTHLHQHLIVSLGLNRLSHTMLAVNVQHLIHRGVERDLLRNLKPFDLTRHEATLSYIRGYIPQTIFNEILDNEGQRVDTRDAIVDLSANYLNEGEIRELRDRGEITEADFDKQLYAKNYLKPEFNQRKKMLTDDRLWKLQDKYVTIQEHLFRDCVIEEAELRAVLTQAHYTQAEADQAVQNVLAERRMRTFLPTADMVKAIKKGLLDVNDAALQLQCRGYTYDDMVVELLLKLEDKLPPCEDVKLEEKAMIGLLQALGANIGISGKLLRPNVLKYLQCLNADFFLFPPIVSIESSVPSIPTKGNITLKWKATLATHAKIEPQLGPVPLEGEAVVHITHSTGFTITAESPIGKSTAFVFVKVDAPG